MHKNHLVLHEIVVGKIDPVGYPTFVGRDMYLSVNEQLRRIRNMVPECLDQPWERNTMVTHLTNALCLLVIVLGCLTSFAREHEGTRANSILLNGAWEFVRGNGDEDAQSGGGGDMLRWQRVKLPGPFMTYKIWDQEARDTKFV